MALTNWAAHMLQVCYSKEVITQVNTNLEKSNYVGLNSAT